MVQEKTQVEKVKSELRSKYLGSDLVDLITAKTPKEWVEERPIGGGGTAKYVAGYHFTERFNEAFGFLWSEKIKDVVLLEERPGDNGKGRKHLRSQIVARVEVTVRVPATKITRILPDGTKEIIERESLEFSKEQFGGAEIKRYSKDVMDRKTGNITFQAGDSIDLANDYKAAVTDGKKKCGLEFGFFSDIYSERKDDEKGLSREQLEVLYSTGKKAGKDEEQVNAWVEEQTSKKITDLDPVEVLGLLPKLRELIK